MADSFDFVIVGGGTAGCLLANRISSSKSAPSVLLIEAGGDGASLTYRNPYERYLNAFIYPELDHGYSTVPQKGLGGKSLPYQRGKGLGGSSAINFMIYTPGSAADFDHWAELVGDSDWSWEAAKERLQRVENLHDNVPAQLERYAHPKSSDHGYNGPIDVSLPSEWEHETQLVLDAAVELQYPLNPDLNSGNPIGFGVAVSSSHGGFRTTSASANLETHPLTSLMIWTNTKVGKILFEGKKAIGIETTNGKKAFAMREVVLSAGAIDTPKILLLSGVGPADELAVESININLTHHLPGVGKKLQDHCGVFLTELMDPEFSPKAKFAQMTDVFEDAKSQWAKDHTGPFNHHFSSVVMSFLKDEYVFDTSVFKSLDISTQQFLQQPNIPSYEVLFNGPLIPPTYPLTVNDGYMCTLVVLMNPQSEGQISLASANPEDAPLIDFGYMNSQYDREVLIRAIRQSLKFPKTEKLAKYWRSSILVPKSDSDEDIWEFISAFLTPLWHANGSVKMGKVDDKLACVDSDLKVFGIENLRIADVSVCPFTISSHTQSTAYLIGQAAADRIIKEYQLDA